MNWNGYSAVPPPTVHERRHTTMILRDKNDSNYMYAHSYRRDPSVNGKI